MKNFTNNRKCNHKESRKLALVVTQNAQYQESDEYIRMKKKYEGYVFKVKLYPCNTSLCKMKKEINLFVKEYGFSEKYGDKIIFLEDKLCMEGADKLKNKKALK